MTASAGVRPPTTVEWKRRRLARDLEQIVRWCPGSDLPVTYSCNDWAVWPSITKGLSSLGERDDRSGDNELLDRIAAAARRDRPGGGRFEVMGDGACWVESGRAFIVWKYVDLDDY